MLRPSELLELIGLLYEGAVDGGRWVEALTAVAAAVRSGTFGLTLHELIAGRRPIAEAVLQHLAYASDSIALPDLPEARWASPPLTTVRQPLTEMGALAARTVLRLAQGEEIESPRVELATELVVRDSSARSHKS